MAKMKIKKGDLVQVITGRTSDADKAAAAAVRKQVFGQIAADRIPFIGYHMHFPGVGYVEPLGDGFRYVPASYQLLLNG